MRTIRKIERSIPNLRQRKKVAAYARVSVDSERMHHSLSAQVSYYSSLIQKNPEWEYAGVYAEIIVPYMIRLRFRDFVKECKNLLIYRLSHTEGCAEGLFFCLLFSTDYFERKRKINQCIEKVPDLCYPFFISLRL